MIPVAYPVSTQKLAISSSVVAATTVFSTTKKHIIRVVGDAAFHLNMRAVGSSDAPTTSSMAMFPKAAEYFEVPAGFIVQIIGASGASGSCWITTVRKGIE